MKVAIVGSNETSKLLAPYGEPGWEFWGMNNLFYGTPQVRWSRWFELHDIEKRDGRWFRKDTDNFRGEPINNYLETLASLACPVYMQKQWPEIPNSVEFPLRELKSQFRQIWKGTPAYMVALAIMLMEHDDERVIGVWGVDLTSTEEYRNQKPSMYYYLGLAEGMGIKVVIPDESDLLKVRNIYGFDDVKEDLFVRKLRAHIEQVNMQLNQAGQERITANRKEAERAGMLQALHEVIRIWQS